MNPTRRCSALLSQLCVSSLGGPTTRRPFTPAAVSAPAVARRCETGVRGGRGGANGTGAQLKPSGASTPGAAAALKKTS
ncbi:nocturnin [Scomber scombrus]|uniref:Nocturnin n=1 Tax=Scomber scombrus TaxID=13677 RepID=A0AAV1QDE4_SCOSC